MNQKGYLIAVVVFVVVLIGGSMAYRSYVSNYAGKDTAAVETTKSASVETAKSASTETAESASAGTAESAAAVETESAEETTVHENVTYAPEFKVYDQDGNAVSLSGITGEMPIIVNLWASWCPPCKAELPHFDAAAKEYEGQIRFMMIDLCDGVQETKDLANALIEENGYEFPVYFDSEGSAVEAFAVYSIPQTILIGKNGELVGQVTGSLSAEALQEYIDQLLAY
ncbi:MAG: TlpA family protein disulfide reductase [Lachnospiraceae bacterium]|nr:TlpA family protein disulfide reductase [Lachnospiraceae bacterium]